jgi:hypothetical protein
MADGAHTPTPWVVRETIMHGTRYGGLWIEPEDAEYLVPLTGSGGAKSYTSRIVDIQDHDHNDANARFIVQAVNAHDDLVEALKAARTVIQEDREALFESVTVAGIASTMDDTDRPHVERLDTVLAQIDAALSRHGDGK